MKDVSCKTLKFMLIAASVITLTGCLENGDTVVEQGSEIDIVPTQDPSTVVCNPFEEGDETSANQGIVAHLKYLTDDQPRYSTVVDYMAFAHAVNEVDLFFNSINIATRPFDRGFMTQSGATILTPEGDTLYEYFALSFRGRMHLGGETPPGDYQMAILSDDGAILRMDTGSGMTTIVDNDGTHPTRMGCATQPVHFGHGQKIPFELDYYQGPRFHIAMMVLWRPWPSGGPADVQCGKEGNSMYFDSTQDPPTPQPAFNNLIARGWSVMDASSYSLPADEGDPGSNPCNAPAPVIFNFEQISVTTTSATLSWKTDIPATSQIIYTNQATGVTGETLADSLLSTDHVITVSGLTPNSIYTMKAVSASSSGRSTESSALVVRTRR